MLIENHAIRLLEAQIVTGGIVDPHKHHRLGQKYNLFLTISGFDMFFINNFALNEQVLYQNNKIIILSVIIFEEKMILHLNF